MMTDKEEMYLRELAAGRCVIPKVTEALGPMSLWSKAAFDAEIRKAVEAEREACAKVVGEFAQKWWSIHCASNKHMETTRKAHDDFCALQATIRARGEACPK